MPDAKISLSALAAETQDVYERNAARFDAERPKGLHEKHWIDRFLSRLAPGDRVLDLGCGAGDPIAAYINGRGFRVTGVDASSAMLELVRRRMPEGDWRFGDMRHLDLPERFHGILGWNSFFHLTRDEQRAVLPRLVRHLAAPGVLMLTVGPEDGEVGGHVGGDAVYHASLSPQEYHSILAALGMKIAEFVVEDPACDDQTILVAEMAAP